MDEIFNEELTREELIDLIRKNILLSGGMTIAMYNVIENHPNGRNIKIDPSTSATIKNFAETAKILSEFLK